MEDDCISVCSFTSMPDIMDKLYENVIDNDINIFQDVEEHQNDIEVDNDIDMINDINISTSNEMKEKPYLSEKKIGYCYDALHNSTSFNNIDARKKREDKFAVDEAMYNTNGKFGTRCWVRKRTKLPEISVGNGLDIHCNILKDTWQQFNMTGSIMNKEAFKKTYTQNKRKALKEMDKKGKEVQKRK